MARLRLTSDDVEYLRELATVSAGTIYLQSQRRLETAGLITINKGRFGEYTRITERGLAVSSAEAAPVPQVVAMPVGVPVRGIDHSLGGKVERKAMITAARRITKHRG